MNIKRVLLLVIFTSLLGCGEAESTLNNAITLSRDGLSLIKQSKNEELNQSERDKFLKDGNEKISLSKKSYQRLISEHPKNGLYLNNYGWVQMRTGDLKGAKKSFDIASKYKGSIHPQESLNKNIEELDKLLGKN